MDHTVRCEFESPPLIDEIPEFVPVTSYYLWINQGQGNVHVAPPEDEYDIGMCIWVQLDLKT